MNLQVVPVPGPGAEDVVIDDQGYAFTGTEDGAIFRIDPSLQQVTRVADTGGRPLGLELLPDGQLLVCDARLGLLDVNPTTGAVRERLPLVDGRPMVFCNNAAVSDDGKIWFSDSSRAYGIDHWKRDFVENTRSGRLLRLDPDGTVATAIDGLAFANGVALAADGSFVAVAETGARTVQRLWLTGPRRGQRDLLVGNLPGYPDNIARGSDGLIWVSIASPLDPVVERLQTGPMALRKAATRLPARLQPKPQQTVRVQAYDAAGRLVRDINLSPPDYHMVTGVREHAGRLWLGSLHEPAVAVLDL